MALIPVNGLKLNSMIFFSITSSKLTELCSGPSIAILINLVRVTSVRRLRSLSRQILIFISNN